MRYLALVPTMRLLFTAVLPLMGYALVVQFAHAQNGQKGMAEMRMAERQAGLASTATRLPEVRQHLQQALNCLEGAGGSDYRAAAGDPCAGSGAERSLAAHSVNRIRVQKAIRLASVGVTFHDFEPAHFTAQAVDAVLQEGTR